jgi:hypothetical protein
MSFSLFLLFLILMKTKNLVLAIIDEKSPLQSQKIIKLIESNS